MTESGLFGSSAALLSAAAWALGIVLWRRIGDVLSPLSMNLNKCLIGMHYIGVVILLTGFEPVDLRALVYLGLSGFIGISLADTFFFASLIHLGSRATAVIGTLFPVFTAVSAVVFLGERPSPLLWVGTSLTTIGVFIVIMDRMTHEKKAKNVYTGLIYAFLSLVCTTIAVLLAKVGVASVSPLEATLIRLAFGFLGLLLWLSFKGSLRQHLSPLRDLQMLKSLILVVFIGTFGGFWLSLVALKYVDACVATILNSTTPLFVLPLAAVSQHERITLKSVVGAIIAVGGVALIMIVSR